MQSWRDLAAYSFVALIGLLISPAHAAPKPAVPNLDFIDRFETLDESRWFISDGWANAEWMASTFRRAQVAATPGGLVLTLSKNQMGDARPFDGGEIRTNQQYPFGYFEARLRAPRDTGIVTGLFSYAAKQGDFGAQEIDVEIVGRDTHVVELTIHSGALTETAKVKLKFDAADGFHTYGFDWRRKSVRWYIDGRLVHQMHGKTAPIPDRPQALMLDLWNTARLVKWAGGMTPDETGPWTLTAACMAYASRYTGRPICAP